MIDELKNQYEAAEGVRRLRSGAVETARLASSNGTRTAAFCNFTAGPSKNSAFERLSVVRCDDHSGAILSLS
jgi:hypothetical protein